jgi:hypothetical protein
MNVSDDAVWARLIKSYTQSSEIAVGLAFFVLFVADP